MEKLFHREKLPALEHNIIYTPRRTRVNQQNVIGEHFEVQDLIRTASSNLRLLCEYPRVLEGSS